MAEDALFKILNERPMSVSELARRLNVRREYLSGYLEALRDSGKLDRVMVGRSYVYQPCSDVSGSGADSMIRTAILEEEEE